MSFEAQFGKMLPHTVTLTAPTGHNPQGRPTYTGGVAKPYKARVVGALTSLRTTSAMSETQEFMVYVNMGSDVVTDEYQLVLPNDPAFASPTNPFIYSVERLTDERGHHHVKLVCGFAFHHQTKL